MLFFVPRVISEIPASLPKPLPKEGITPPHYFIRAVAGAILDLAARARERGMEPEGYHSTDPSIGHFFPTRNIAIPLSSSRFQLESQWVTAHELNVPSPRNFARIGPALSTIKKTASTTSLILRTIPSPPHVDKSGDCRKTAESLACAAICCSQMKFFRSRIKLVRHVRQLKA